MDPSSARVSAPPLATLAAAAADPVANAAHAGAGGHKAASHDMAGMNDEGDSKEGGMAGVKHADDGKPGGSQLVGVGAFSVVVFSSTLTIVFIFGPA